MKASIHALAATLAFAGAAHAQVTEPLETAPAASSSIAWNVAVTSDYRYRAISQTRLRPALQGGVDYVHTDGWYAGVWASTIKWVEDAGGDGEVEIDVYGGKRGALSQGLSYDVGVLRYVYPDNGLGRLPGWVNAHTTEVYAQLGYGPAYVKYSHATTNLFGFVDSENSGYLDIGANLDVGHGLTLQLHAGRQEVKNNPASDYTDWKIGVSRSFDLATVSLAYLGTNASKSAYTSPANGKFTGRDALQLTVSRTF
ncbi:TorF family putative porin [Massilia timonae]|uniref:TorF family putative porin n=1 Tax=Massilia timonae TaxID=47229 RepID=UPI0028D3F3BE|nr:TorF family putative porin [Massilia timonae]